MVGYAGSPTYTAYVDMTLTRSKVKVKVTGLLNFRQLAKPCMLAVMTAAPLTPGFLVIITHMLGLTADFLAKQSLDLSFSSTDQRHRNE